MVRLRAAPYTARWRGARIAGYRIPSMMKTLAAAFLLCATAVFAQQPQPQPPKDPAEAAQTPASKTVLGPQASGLRAVDTKPFRWRSVGPANMGGRIADFAVVEKDPYTIYAGVGTGGVLKTTNNGTTWQGIFDKEPVASVGAVAVSQNNPKIVWVGTGEGNSRNSSSWGDGVYKSADGGETWTNMGLRDTQDVPKISLDPKNDDVVYVAALGHLWGATKS